MEYRDDAVGQSPQEAIKKIDKDKVKRKKSCGDISRKKDLMDDDISLKGNWKMVLNWLPTARRSSKRRGKAGPKLQEMLKKGSWLHLLMLMLDMDIDHQCQVIARERRGSPLERPLLEGKQRHDYVPGSHHHNHHAFPEDRNRLGRLGYSERDQKRHVQENHV